MNNMLTHAAATPPEDSNTRLIPLTKGQFAIVDAVDFDWLNQWKWHAWFGKKRNKWYAVRNYPKGCCLSMHRLIMNAENGKEVDHRDGNGLNNCRSNLRVGTHQQNAFNRGPIRRNISGFKGVCWKKGCNKWQAQVRRGNKNFYLGLFDTAAEAGAAYIEAAKRLHGEFFRS